MTLKSVGPPPNPSEIRDTGQSETGPRANGIRPLDQLNLTTEGSGPVDIVHAAESTHTTPLAPEILATCRIDGCPKCVYNAEAPFDAYPTTDGYVATYRCSDCDHRWSTAWMDR